jgi:hypothetical protein
MLVANSASITIVRESQTSVFEVFTIVLNKRKNQVERIQRRMTKPPRAGAKMAGKLNHWKVVSGDDIPAIQRIAQMPEATPKEIAR